MTVVVSPYLPDVVTLINKFYLLRMLSFQLQRDVVITPSFLLNLLVLRLRLELIILWCQINIKLLIKLKLVKLKVVVKSLLKMLKQQKELSIFVVRLLVLKNIMTHLKENIAPVKKVKVHLKADQGLKLKIIYVLELVYQTHLQVLFLALVTHAHEHLESQRN